MSGKCSVWTSFQACDEKFLRSAVRCSILERYRCVDRGFQSSSQSRILALCNSFYKTRETSFYERNVLTHKKHIQTMRAVTTDASSSVACFRCRCHLRVHINHHHSRLHSAERLTERLLPRPRRQPRGRLRSRAELSLDRERRFGCLQTPGRPNLSRHRRDSR